MIVSQRILILGGASSFFIGGLHIIAILIGAPAYDFLDAPELSILAQQGSYLPTLITLGVSFFFFIFAAYAFSGVGWIRTLPLLKKMLTLIACLYIVRGMAVIWYVFLVFVDSPMAVPREIVFSFFSLAVGYCYFLGVRSLPF